MKTIQRVLLSILLMAAAALPSPASENPNNSRGFAADGMYQSHGVDNVNAFNGNLLVTIPLGRTYTAGDHLQYGFTLTYNSAIWDYEKRHDGGLVRTETVPARLANAGLGWRVTLGELFFHDHLVYASPDGQEHSFKAETIHFGNENGGADPTSDCKPASIWPT